MNNIPEKIYLREVDLVEVGNCLSENNDKTDIEYTRTDALIEKALAFIRSCTTYDGLGYKAKCVNIEDFRKYMKEE